MQSRRPYLSALAARIAGRWFVAGAGWNASTLKRDMIGQWSLRPRNSSNLRRHAGKGDLGPQGPQARLETGLRGVAALHQKLPPGMSGARYRAATRHSREAVIDFTEIQERHLRRAANRVKASTCKSRRCPLAGQIDGQMIRRLVDGAR